MESNNYNPNQYPQGGGEIVGPYGNQYPQGPNQNMQQQYPQYSNNPEAIPPYGGYNNQSNNQSELHLTNANSQIGQENISQNSTNAQSSESGRICCAWCTNIIIFILLPPMILVPILTRQPQFVCFFLFPGIFFSVLYCLTAICSSKTYKYLSQLKNAPSIHKYMEKLFYTGPVIKMTCISFHYDYSHSNKGRTTRHRRTTHTDEEYFKICSWRDNSGLFNVEQNSKKNYLRMKIDLDVEFADQITKYDYFRLKENMIQRNRYRDMCMDYVEEIDLKGGYERFNLIRLGSQECLISKFWFILFSIIPCLQCYKSFFNSRCAEQKFILKKIISSRYNLHTEQKRNEYYSFNPGVKINNEQNYFNNQPQEIASVEMPSEEEILQAENFSNNNTQGKIFRINSKKPQTFEGNQNQSNINNQGFNYNNNNNQFYGNNNIAPQQNFNNNNQGGNYNNNINNNDHIQVKDGNMDSKANMQEKFI